MQEDIVSVFCLCGQTRAICVPVTAVQGKCIGVWDANARNLNMRAGKYMRSKSEYVRGKHKYMRGKQEGMCTGKRECMRGKGEYMRGEHKYMRGKQEGMYTQTQF
jgi:hypothetical protein